MVKYVDRGTCIGKWNGGFTPFVGVFWWIIQVLSKVWGQGHFHRCYRRLHHHRLRSGFIRLFLLYWSSLRRTVSNVRFLKFLQYLQIHLSPFKSSTVFLEALLFIFNAILYFNVIDCLCFSDPSLPTLIMNQHTHTTFINSSTSLIYSLICALWLPRYNSRLISGIWPLPDTD